MGETRPTSVLIVGAGIAGLVCGRALAQGGCEVQLVDKGSRPGGRLATREQPPHTFDHGAQYVTAEGEAFRAEVEAWGRAGVVARWAGKVCRGGAGTLHPAEMGSEERGRDRWVATPGMNALAAYLAEGLRVRARCRIEALRFEGERWWARGGGASFSSDVAVVTVPAPQATPLLADAPSLQRAVGEVEMAPTWAVLVTLAEALPHLPDGVFVEDDGPLAWLARDSSKPGRGAGERWVLHASAAWTAEHLQLPEPAVVDALLEAFRRVAEVESLPAASYREAHRWRYAAARRPVGQACLWDPSRAIGVAADWCLGPRVEDAWRSGTALARTILRGTLRR